MSTKEVGVNMLVFIDGQSLLSNFNNSIFIVKGIQYDCNEHFYVSGKAEFAKNPTAVTAEMLQKLHKRSKTLAMTWTNR